MFGSISNGEFYFICFREILFDIGIKRLNWIDFYVFYFLVSFGIRLIVFGRS